MKHITGVASTHSVYIEGVKLSPERSLKYRNHSPDGFMWGYGGSGPAQLAFAILLECEPVSAARMYQDFKWEVIAKLDKDKDFTLSVEEIKNWVKDKKIS